MEREEVDDGRSGRRWSTTGRQNEAATKIQPSDGRRGNEAVTWGSKASAAGGGRWGVAESSQSGGWGGWRVGVSVLLCKFKGGTSTQQK